MNCFGTDLSIEEKIINSMAYMNRERLVPFGIILNKKNFEEIKKDLAHRANGDKEFILKTIHGDLKITYEEKT